MENMPHFDERDPSRNEGARFDELALFERENLPKNRVVKLRN